MENKQFFPEQKLLGRSLKLEKVTEVTQMARRIGAILLLEPELDANYEAVKQATYPWSVQKQ
jgi:hypothetical protein